MASPNSNFDQIASSTLRNYLSKNFTDNIFNGMPFYAWMNKNGRKVMTDGGEFLVEPLEYGKNTTVRWMSGYDTVDTSPQDGLTSAQFNWKMLGAAVTYSRLEDAKNSGRSQVIDLLKAKINQAKMSVQDNFAQNLFLDGTADSNNAITGLGAMVANSGTYGNINRSTYIWWKSYVEATASVLNEDDMRIAFNSVSKNMTKPDFIMTTQALYQKYESLVVPAYRTQDRRVADLGFDSLQFKGVPIMWDDYCPAGYMYFLKRKSAPVLQ